MPYLRTYDSAEESLHSLYRTVKRDGNDYAPRGSMTREVEDMTIHLSDPTDCWANPVGRQAKFAIAAAEALQLIGGFSDPERLVQLAPNFGSFLNGGVLLGAYGVRLRPIISEVVQKLSDDPLSRQGVAMIWDPVRDIIQTSRDTPCTLGATFRLRDGRLNMTTHMRSNDLFWGWTYDVFQFAQLQCSIANVLGAYPGTYTHHADSFHYYHRDVERLERIEAGGMSDDPVWNGVQGKTVRDMQERAESLFYGDVPDDASDAEKEMSHACQLT